jgi:hypothetical protein
MIRNCYYAALLLGLVSCTITDSSNTTVTPNIPVISDLIAQGKASSPTAFVLKTAFYRSRNMFGKDGYIVDFYDKAADCSNVLSPISFFITKLEKGVFKGEGPYFYYYTDPKNFGTTSYFGCDVIITNVTATTLEGKVKGGDPAQNQYIDGTFSATLCK